MIRFWCQIKHPPFYLPRYHWRVSYISCIMRKAEKPLDVLDQVFPLVFCFTTVSSLAALQTHSACLTVSCSSRTPHSHIHHRGTAVYSLNTVKMSGVFLWKSNGKWTCAHYDKTVRQWQCVYGPHSYSSKEKPSCHTFKFNPIKLFAFPLPMLCHWHRGTSSPCFTLTYIFRENGATRH